MNIDAEIKAAKERINRQIGQWGRHAHAENEKAFQLTRESCRPQLVLRVEEYNAIIRFVGGWPFYDDPVLI